MAYPDKDFKGYGFKVAPPPEIPPFKAGDILKLREFDGSIYKGVISKVNEATGVIKMAEERWGTLFFGETKRRLDDGEVDYDYSDKPKHEIPFTVERHIHWVREG